MSDGWRDCPYNKSVLCCEDDYPESCRDCEYYKAEKEEDTH